MRDTSAPMLSGVGIIVFCFVASALLRLTDNSLAFAQGISDLAQTAGTAAPWSPTRFCRPFRNASRSSMRRSQLAERRQTLNVSEAKLAEQMAAFEKAQKNLEQTLAKADKAAENDITRMVTVYETMKPQDAAKIVERMDVTFAAGLLAQMKPATAAKILAGMNADNAYAVTLTIASRNSRVPTR